MFDTKKVVYNQNEPSYKVKYYVYKDDTLYTEYFTKKTFEHKNLKHKENDNTACFSQLPTMLYDFANKYKKQPNRLLFLCNFEHCAEMINRVTYEEILWWITICKKYKLLPNYIDNEFLTTGNFMVKISDIDLNTLYIYLSIIRYLQEDACFIKAIKYLTEDKGMDFYIAFAAASRCCMCGFGHHIIPISKQYPYTSEQHNSINKVNAYSLGETIALKKFLENKKSVTLKDVSIGTSFGRFNLHNTLSKMKVKELIVTRKELLSKDIIKKVYE